MLRVPRCNEISEPLTLNGARPSDEPSRNASTMGYGSLDDEIDSEREVFQVYTFVDLVFDKLPTPKPFALISTSDLYSVSYKTLKALRYLISETLHVIVELCR